MPAAVRSYLEMGNILKHVFHEVDYHINPFIQTLHSPSLFQKYFANIYLNCQSTFVFPLSWREHVDIDCRQSLDLNSKFSIDSLREIAISIIKMDNKHNRAA